MKAGETKQKEAERTRVQQALRESEELFRLMFDCSPAGAVLVAPDFRFLRCNEAYCRFLGYRESELQGKTFLDVTHPDDLMTGRQEIEGMLAGTLDATQIQKRYLHRGGAAVWGEVNIRLLRDPAGKPLYFLTVVQDITERKRAELELRAAYVQLEATEEELRARYDELQQSERELRESEERFRGLAEAMSDAILMVDSESGRILEANTAACALYGYTLEEMLALSVLDISAEREATARAIKQHDLHCHRRYHKKKNGDIIPLEIFQSVHPWGGRMAATGLLRDLTHELRMEEERRRADRLESVGLLAGGIAHDFNNILMGVLGNISLARMALADGRDVRGFLEDAEKASLRARDLTKQLLTFSRGGAPVKSLASLKDVIEEAAGLMLRGSNVRAAASHDPDLWPVNIDIGQMNQVFTNLIINAMQAMPEGGHISITAGNAEVGPDGRENLPPGRYVRVVITDRGVGIPPEAMARIFDPYFTTKQTGSGLGLATAYSIVKHHGGSITAQSSPGRGAAFTILIPASDQREEAERPRENGMIMGRGRILLVDDDEAVLMTTSLMLEHLGYSVGTAREGKEGIAAYQKAMGEGHPFDAVIMDLTIPGGMGGQDAVRELLQLDPAARAIVASGYSQDQVLAEFQAYGFKGVLAKPYRLQEIGRVLHQVLQPGP